MTVPNPVNQSFVFSPNLMAVDFIPRSISSALSLNKKS